MFSWPWHMLSFVDGLKVWWSATKFERPHWTESDGSYCLGWHSREFFLVAVGEWRRMYIASPTMWKEYKPCCALSVPSSAVFCVQSIRDGQFA